MKEPEKYIWVYKVQRFRLISEKIRELNSSASLAASFERSFALHLRGLFLRRAFRVRRRGWSDVRCGRLWGLLRLCGLELGGGFGERWLWLWMWIVHYRSGLLLEDNTLLLSPLVPLSPGSLVRLEALKSRFAAVTFSRHSIRGVFFGIASTSLLSAQHRRREMFSYPATKLCFSLMKRCVSDNE